MISEKLAEKDLRTVNRAVLYLLRKNREERIWAKRQKMTVWSWIQSQPEKEAHDSSNVAET